MKELKKLKIDKIAFCIKHAPANRFECLLKKCEGDMNEIIKIAQKFWGEDFSPEEFHKAEPDKEELVECLKEAALYAEDLPDYFKDSLDKIISYALKGFQASVETGEEENKKTEEDSEDGNGKKKVAKSNGDEEDKFPSFVLPKHGLVSVVKDDTYDEDPDEDYLPQSIINRLRRLEGTVDKKTIDRFPSIPIPVSVNKLMEMIEEEEAELHIDDPDFKEVAQKKSIDSQEGLESKKLKKEEEDLFPSLMTPMDMGFSGNED